MQLQAWLVLDVDILVLTVFLIINILLDKTQCLLVDLDTT